MAVSITQSTLNLDLDEFYKFWPNTETICFRSDQTASDSDGNVLTCSLKAFRRAPTYRELAASGGVYTGQDLVWLVPNTLLPPGVSPKPGDLVIDNEENEWDVLEASKNAFSSHWRLICRDPVIVFDLRDTFTIKAPTNAQDAAGARTPTLTATGTTYNGRFQLVSEAPAEGRGKTLLRREYQLFTAVEITGLSHEHQVLDSSSNVYEFLRYTNRARLGELSMIECVRFGDSA